VIWAPRLVTVKEPSAAPNEALHAHRRP
jgi:hypothetical protein